MGTNETDIEEGKVGTTKKVGEQKAEVFQLVFAGIIQIISVKGIRLI